MWDPIVAEENSYFRFEFTIKLPTKLSEILFPFNKSMSLLDFRNVFDAVSVINLVLLMDNFGELELGSRI